MFHIITQMINSMTFPSPEVMLTSSFWPFLSHLTASSYAGLVVIDWMWLDKSSIASPALLDRSYPATWACVSLTGIAIHWLSLMHYGGFILLPLSVFQLRMLGTLVTTGLTVKDWDKEGIQYLSLFLILFPLCFCHIEQKAEIFLGPPSICCRWISRTLFSVFHIHAQIKF